MSKGIYMPKVWIIKVKTTGKNIKKGRDNTSRETMSQANYNQEILAIKD